MIKVFPLEQLDEITTLEVKHSRIVIRAFHQYNPLFLNEKPRDWFSNVVANRKVQYEFTISQNQCEIRIYFENWGYTDLIKESGKTTEQACQKAIKKFYKNYKQ